MPDLSQSVAFALAISGALVAAWAASSSRPTLAIACLFILSSLSRLVVETPIGTMRIEQPAIALVAIVLVARGRITDMRSASPMVLLIAAAFAGFLGVLAASSLLVAPQPTDSLRVVAWFAISMVGGLVVYVLARPAPPATALPFSVGGAAKGLVGIVAAASFLVLGSSADWGVQESLGFLPRVHAFTWEANIYASFLAISLPFALESARGPRRRLGYLLLALVLIGLPLGATRGAYLGAAAGVAVYFTVRLIIERRPTELVPLGVTMAGLFAVGLVAGNVLLPNAVERYIADSRPTPTATSAEPSGTAGVPPTQQPTAIPSIRPYPDTISFRLDRVPLAIDDLRLSPLIGLGAESFGQLHADPSQNGSPPDHLAIMAVAVLHDAGILGAAALVAAFLLLMRGLWSTARTAHGPLAPATSGLIAAFIGAIAAMLIAYQATNALHFASNWLIIGAAAAAIQRGPSDP